MTRGPVASLARERAALLSADIEEQLTARQKDGMRPLIAVLAKARRAAADAIAALIDTAPSDASTRSAGRTGAGRGDETRSSFVS